MVDNLIMPEKVSVGFKGGPTFSTDKVVAVSQQTRRFQNQEVAIHKYSWNYQNADNGTVDPALEKALIDWLRHMFFDRRGDLKALLMKDWADFELIAEPFFIGDGATTTAQVTKTYTVGFNPYVRIIRHLKAGAVFKLDDVPLVLGVDYTISSTALVTYATPPADGAVGTVDGEFYVVVNLEGDAFSTSFPEQNIDIVNLDLQAIEDPFQ
jgi:uncharacterized protein (TIGR02217 family)